MSAENIDPPFYTSAKKNDLCVVYFVETYIALSFFPVYDQQLRVGTFLCIKAIDFNESLVASNLSQILNNLGFLL